MRKLFVCFLVVGVLAAFGGIDTPRAAAQPAKKDAAKTKKTGGGTIEISQGRDGKFRFAIRNADGKYLGGSGPIGFATEKDARAAIDALKKVLATAQVTMKKAAAKEKDK